MNEIVEGQVTRASLGRLGFIGELYDVRSESFSSRSLIKPASSSQLIESRDLGRMEFDYKFIKNVSDRFELINVETELQVSVLLGLIRLEGSGKFLTEDRKSEKTISCSLMCKILTVSEKLFAVFDEFIPFVDLTALNDPQYTHVIVEVIWGANCCLTLETTCNSDSQKLELEGHLEAELEKLKMFLSVKGGGKLQKKDSDLSSKENVQIKIYADVVPENSWPTSTESFCRFVSDLPGLIKKVNNGKGKPLNYVMIPLHTIRKIAKLESAFDVVVKKIDESFLLSVVYLFEEITQIKQKFYDLLNKLKENEKYVEKNNIRELEKQRKTLSLKETDLKQIIGESWVDVKSGKKPLRDLIKELEKFKSFHLKLFTYEDFLDSFSPVLNKLSIVRSYISKNVIYLGIGEKFDSLQALYLSSEFIVLVISPESEKNDPELHRNTCHYFLTLADQSRPFTKYVVVDLNYVESREFLNCRLTQTKCYHLKGTETLSGDLYAEYLADKDSNYARLGEGSKKTYCQHKPGNRVVLEIICPGFEEGTCPPDPRTWICYRCKSNIEYGFDEHFYCSCGKSQAALFEFRCNNIRHGCSFIPPKTEFLKQVLSKLRPLKEMNVLILGQSGVGKSTWINSIVNYLSYNSLETAKECGVISVIPASFTMYSSKTRQKHVIEIGEKNAEEITEAGSSATQYAHTYNFLWEDRCVRIIDTPGLGDTRGIDQDKLNLLNIIDHIGHLKELHGVCILLKANDNRISAMFAYCLKELLVHLHKSVTKNIVFCFTNARNSFYSPGQTSALLEKVISRLGVDAKLDLGHHNMFCLDNEAFLFLCSLKYPEICHEEHLIKSFSQSWEISLNETKRLFNTIKSFEPHLLEETITLVNARNRILFLTKPLAECSKTIQLNLSALERKKAEINTFQTTIEELTKKLEYTELYLEEEALPMPRTVCTSSSCIDYVSCKTVNIRVIEYKTHCHTNCVLKLTPQTTNNKALQRCWAMRNGKCKICGCGWENHMHLTYEQRRKERKVIDKNVEKFLKDEISAKEAIENFVENLRLEIEKYKKEQEFIIQASVKLGMFLRRNAITCFNDSVEEYLLHLIKEEEEKPFKSETEKKLLENMRNTLAYYKSEVQILQKVINEGDDKTEELTSKDVYEIEQSLFQLKLMGENIRKSVEMNRSSNTAMRHYAETPLQIVPLKRVTRKSTWKLFNKFHNSVKFKNSNDL